MFQPFESFTKAWGNWQAMTEEATARTASFYETMGKLSAQSTEQAFAALEEVTKLTRANLTYQRELGEQLRQVTLDAFKAPAATAATKTA